MNETIHYIKTTFKEYEATNYELFLRCIKGNKRIISPLFILPSCQYSCVIDYNRHNLRVQYDFNTSEYPGFLQVLYTIPKRSIRSIVINKENKVITYNTNCAFRKKFKLLLNVTHIYSITEEEPNFKKRHIQNMIEHINSLYLNSDFSDLQISLGNLLIPVHKFILAANSSVFESMFTFNITEEQKQEQKVENIILQRDYLPYLNYESFSALLRYLYTEDLREIKNIASELIFLADMYNIMNLVELCKKTLVKHINKENAAEILIIAEKLNLNDLMNLCHQYIQENNTEKSE